MRVEQSVNGFRSDMLWLNDHAHQQSAEPLETDVTSRLGSICHIKSRGSGSDGLWKLESLSAP